MTSGNRNRLLPSLSWIVVIYLILEGGTLLLRYLHGHLDVEAFDWQAEFIHSIKLVAIAWLAATAVKLVQSRSAR